VGFHSQCSIAPPRYAVWLSTANHTTTVARRAATLAVHGLAADQHDLAELFGGATGDDVDKFARCATVDGPDGVPLLAACPSRFVGRPIAMLDTGGDHVCVVLEPIDTAAGPLAPLRLRAVADLDAGHDAGETRPDQPGATSAPATSSATVTSASSATTGSSSPG
jgi:flavin reductase (DIM6/NTAB) family NADH-FMN oxidoreductase RutF